MGSHDRCFAGDETTRPSRVIAVALALPCSCSCPAWACSRVHHAHVFGDEHRSRAQERVRRRSTRPATSPSALGSGRRVRGERQRRSSASNKGIANAAAPRARCSLRRVGMVAVATSSNSQTPTSVIAPNAATDGAGSAADQCAHSAAEGVASRHAHVAAD
jgi:hypothetical protein